MVAILVLLFTLFVVLKRWRRRTGRLKAAAAKPVAVIVDSAVTDTAVTSTPDDVQISIASAADGAIAVHGEDEPRDAKASDRVSNPSDRVSNPEEVEVEMAGVGESTDTLSSTAIGSPGASAKALGVAVQGSTSAGSAGALETSSSRGLRNTRALQAMAEWDWKAADLTWMKKIGFGSFGAVFKVQHGDEFLAAKRIKSDDSDEARAEMESMLVREFRALSKVAHENVVHLLGVVRDDPSYVCLLMELADHGSLRQVLDARPGDIVGDLPVQSALAFDIANGLAFCHAQTPQPLLHHDIKSANVLLFSSGHPRLTAKLSDFGLAVGVSGASTAFATTRTKTHAAGGTFAYRAPETFSDKYTKHDRVMISSFSVSPKAHAIPSTRSFVLCRCFLDSS